MGEVHDHTITLTIMARGGRHAAVLTTDVKDYVVRRGGIVTGTDFDPVLTLEERQQAQEDALEAVAGEVRAPRPQDLPQNTHEKLPGETEDEFSSRMARLQSAEIDKRKATAEARRDPDPVAKFKGVFGDAR